MIETRLLRNALMLEKHQNFARAAKELHISQPTLSRSIQLLERTVGERLFDRTSRTILPTQAGEIMLKHARIIIASSGAMQEEIEQHQGLLKGSLFIGSGPYAGAELLAPAIGRFSRRYPGIKIDIRVDDWRRFSDRLMQEDFDYVLMETSELDDSADFEITRLIRHPVFFFCRLGHPLREQDRLTIRDLSQFPLVTPALPKRLSDLFCRLFFSGRDTGAPITKLQNYSCNDLGTIKATISNSDSIGLGTYGTLAPELKAGLFTALPFRIPNLVTHHDIVKRKGLSLSPAARALIEVLIEVDKEQSILEADLIESLGSEITI